MNDASSPQPPLPSAGLRTHALLRHEALLDGLPLGVALLDHTGVIQAINAEGARLLGGTAQHYRGQLFARIWSQVTRSDAAAVQEQLSAVYRDGQPLQPALVEIHRQTEGSTPVEWTCLRIDQDGEPGLSISFRDVSRERDLQQDRNRLIAIADESPYPIIELDRHANLVYANPMMTELLGQYGYSPNGFPRIAPRALPELVTQCLSLGMAIHGEEVRLPEASFSWILCPVPANAHVRGYAVELTAVHRVQQALQRTADELQANNLRLDGALQEAKAATRTKAAFLATVSHELRTPMNGVIGMTSLLLETAMTPEQRTYADTIRQCGESLLLLINDVLECSKIEAGKLELECLDFNLRVTLDEVLRQFAERAESKGLELIGLVHAEVPTGLRGDPARLRQVLTNLVGNAIKFTDHGEVSLQAYLAEDLPDAAVIRFEITDSGIGIHPDTVEKLFKPFVQADSSTTRRYGGTGLGLSISKQLIELMNGHIGVHSAPGQGSTFWCTARFLKQPVAEPAISPLADLQGRRVLIVDDNESNRLILRHLTSGWGMIAEEADNAQAALERIAAAESRGEPYHCALLDVVMPGKDGFQLAGELQQRPSNRMTRVVMMTSILQQGHAERARLAGARAYLSKPVRHDELRDCLRRVLDVALITQSLTTPGDSASPQFITRHNLPSQTVRPTILIVEDNAINQKLAARMVEKLGYQSDVVENGREALAAIESNRYAAIFMDCQMPVMDGFEATQAIRALEASGKMYSSAGHLPIIAVTANAMQGDRERCLAAGMDDYMAKPIKLIEVRDTLARWIILPSPHTAPDTEATQPAPMLPHQGIFDPVQMTYNIGDDRDLVMQLIDLFLDGHPAVLAKIRTALSRNDANTVAILAHTLKGSARNLCAAEVAFTAGRLEAIGHLGRLEDAPPLCAQLQADLQRLIHALISYRRAIDPPNHQAA
ncbi:MAG: response regulator [Nitrospira sp.]|jgi:two-component system sensor histidine kinase/response regulator|nr:response regulator [Nitrospira sp.]